MKAEALVNALTDTLAELEGETLRKTLLKKKAEPLVDALVDKVAEEEAKTLSDTFAEVEAQPLVDALADTLVEVVDEEEISRRGLKK